MIPYFKHLDRPTPGPDGFTGPLRQTLKNSIEHNVVNFTAIDAPIPEINAAILSKDQFYLFEIWQAVVTGKCCPKLSKKDPGPFLTLGG